MHLSVLFTPLFGTESLADDTFAPLNVIKYVSAAAGLLTPLLGATWWLAGRHYRGRLATCRDIIEGLETQVRNLQDDRQVDQTRIAQLLTEVTGRDVQIAELRKKLVPYYHGFNKIKPLHDQLVKEVKAGRELIAKLSTDAIGTDEQLKLVRDQLEQRERQVKRTDRRIRTALRHGGNLWAVKALQKVPKFRPLADRNRAIISVLNLKGGVGKTTVTAQLGIALARRGYRVLLVDLDLQGSLSSLFLPYDKIEPLAANKLLLQDYLHAASTDRTHKLAGYAQRVLDVPESAGYVDLVATSDNLAYAELSLTLQWLLRQGERDTRFLLRNALHPKSVSRKYDIVLLDCPPLVNISCVNAMAASDYVLVPATLGRQAVERVPVLIQRFLNNDHVRRNVNQGLEVLGVLANRTQRDKLTGTEEAVWKQLGTWCHDAAKTPIKQFGTIIPTQTKDLRTADTVAMPDPDSKLAQVFAALAAEIELELPYGCRRAAKAPV